MDVRARFVSEVLQDEGQRLLRNQGKAIEAKVVPGGWSRPGVFR